MAPWIECDVQDEDLNLIPRTRVKKPGGGAHL